MSRLEHPQAQALLGDAELDAGAVQACAGRLDAFARRYLPHLARREQRPPALTVLRGKLSGLDRKTTEPIAPPAGRHRRNLQLFVGVGGGDDPAVRGELRRPVAEEGGDAGGVWILDGAAFPQKGEQSCGAARPWCGRLGKLENCQVGVFLAYAAPRGQALRDARLYLPQDWAGDDGRRLRTPVPAAGAFAEKWRIGLELLDDARGARPGTWVTAADDFGRCTELRAARRRRRR